VPHEPSSAASVAPPNLATPRFPLLNSLRGVAALSVFGAHVVLYLFAVGGIGAGPLLTRLDPGIAIFLLLSSFLLYRPFVQARFDGSPPPALFAFAARRVLRIVPVYWIALPIVALWLGEHEVFTAHGIVTFFGFAQIYQAHTIGGGIGQAWTICVEVTFYAMLPLWAWALRKVPFRSTRGFLASELGALVAIVLFSVTWKAISFQAGPTQAGIGPVKVIPELFTIPAFLDSLAFGMALAVASVALTARSVQPAAVRLIDRAPWLPWLAAAVLWWLSGIGGGTFHVRSTGFYIAHQELNVLVAVGLFLPAIFGDHTRGWLRRVLASRTLVWLATISYGFYLWHLAVMRKLQDGGWVDRSPVAFTLLSFAGSAALGAASYYLVGRYFIALGRRLPRGRRNGAPARDRGAGRTTGAAAAPLPESAGPRPPT
jgi:peptidoglycan/LPS O-acetylase OafA/YrhL